MVQCPVPVDVEGNQSDAVVGRQRRDRSIDTHRLSERCGAAAAAELVGKRKSTDSCQWREALDIREGPAWKENGGPEGKKVCGVT